MPVSFLIASPLLPDSIHLMHLFLLNPKKFHPMHIPAWQPVLKMPIWRIIIANLRLNNRCWQKPQHVRTSSLMNWSFNAF